MSIIEGKYKIWYKRLDEYSNESDEVEVFPREYINYGSAINRARKEFGSRFGNKNYIYHVAKRNPFETYFRDAICSCCGVKFKGLEDSDGWGISSYLHIAHRHPGNFRHSHYELRDLCPDCIDAFKEFAENRKESFKNG